MGQRFMRLEKSAVVAASLNGKQKLRIFNVLWDLGLFLSTKDALGHKIVIMTEFHPSI